jgi:outer membrane protein assembly factor BamB
MILIGLKEQILGAKLARHAWSGGFKVLALTLNAKIRGVASRRAIGVLSVALAVCLAAGQRAAGQNVVFNVNGGFAVATEISPDQTKPQPSFSLPTQSADVKDSMEEFTRLVKHEQWEKAFKSLETIAGKTSTGFIDRGDGVLVPSRLLVRGLLASLPSAGKSAYRLFYDSQATALWDKATGKGEVEYLTNIVNNHLISSVGDRAADRLGDLYFEQGDFEQAITAWRSIIAYCPESKLPKAQVLVKIATALARSGRWTEFVPVEQMVRERYASDAVAVGGRRVLAAEQIAILAVASKSAEPVVETPLADDVELPSEVEPLWQFRFQSRPDPNNQNQPFSLSDIYGRQRANDFIIPAAVDDKRVYVNTFGVEMAFDIDSGKLVWRSGKLHLLQLQQQRQGIAPERYGILVSGDRTWSVLRDPQQANQGVGFAMVVREAATGKEVFTTRRSLSAWNILGMPYLAGDTVYIGGSRTGQGRELAILVLNAKDGKLIRTVTVGNHAVDQNQVYGDLIAQPSLLLHRDRLYVDTHAGALVSLQTQTGALDWGVAYDSPPPMTGYYYNYQPPPLGSSGPIRSAGLLFAKGMRASRLIALQAEGPSLVWNRPVSKTAVILGVDADRIYMGGEELTAYSLKTQELLWATQLPHSASWALPVLTKNRIYQFTSRGICEVNKETGELVTILRGADLDSYGGSLFMTPKALVTVSNLGITAYPRGSAPVTPAN